MRLLEEGKKVSGNTERELGSLFEKPKTIWKQKRRNEKRRGKKAAENL